MTTIDRTTRLSIRETSPRMTPTPPSRRFSEVLAHSGRALLQGAVTAAAYVPGGNLIAAAVRGAMPAETSPAVSTGTVATAGSPESPAQTIAHPLGGLGSDEDLLTRGQEMSLRLLRLQEAISEESRRYTALSNVMHARHEMAKNAINNIR